MMTWVGLTPVPRLDPRIALFPTNASDESTLWRSMATRYACPHTPKKSNSNQAGKN